ncbi:hypothetical protein [Flavobacteriaceae bacterium 14752]|uniref:hypothetical protein n=1 Tax=Mesohalobacter salilacus TaxID=2491711 RepID=UPI000F640353|nr:hypothetical protein EIG84_10120 [Flavobacteriaceae bacterium 14752]
MAYFCNAQNKNGKPITRTYIKLSDWKKLNKRSLTKQDSLNFLIRNNDTLVLTDNKHRPPGVSVLYTYKDSNFLDLYSKTAFRLKNDSTDNSKTTRYWKKPLKVFFADHISGSVKRDFKRFAKSTIDLIDSLSIDFVRNVEDSNVVIYYDDDYNYESRMNRKQNSAYYMHWNRSQISKLSIYVDNTYFFSDKLRLMEIKRLFIMGLGHFQLLDGFPCDSYFSKCISQEKKLSDLDKELLQYHYDYGICKGTDYKTFKAQHKRAKKILKASPNNRMRFFHPFYN